jgi:hypothetical protein
MHPLRLLPGLLSGGFLVLRVLLCMLNLGQWFVGEDLGLPLPASLHFWVLGCLVKNLLLELLALLLPHPAFLVLVARYLLIVQLLLGRAVQFSACLLGTNLQLTDTLLCLLLVVHHNLLYLLLDVLLSLLLTHCFYVCNL